MYAVMPGMPTHSLIPRLGPEAGHSEKERQDWEEASGKSLSIGAAVWFLGVSRLYLPTM